MPVCCPVVSLVQMGALSWPNVESLVRAPPLVGMLDTQTLGVWSLIRGTTLSVNTCTLYVNMSEKELKLL